MRNFAVVLFVTALSFSSQGQAQSQDVKPLCSGVFKELNPKSETKSFRFISLHFRDLQTSTPCADGLTGNYTRLVLIRNDHDDGTPMERRDPIDRLLTQDQAGKVVIARLSLTQPTLTFTTTLGDISWVSGRKGQMSKANIQLDTFATPFFRVDPETVIKIEFEVVSSAGKNVTLASDALSIIGEFAKPAAGGGLINAENLPQLQRAATGIDAAISKFFKEEMSEKKSVELTPAKLSAQPLTATVRLPFGWEVVGNVDVKEFGSWTLLAEAPRKTVFPDSSLKLNDDEKNNFGPFDPDVARINGFHLTPSKTLIEHLSGSEQISAILSDLQTAVANKETGHQTEAAQLLYFTLVTEAHRLGFNMPDSVAIAQAFAKSGRVRGATQVALKNLTKKAEAAAEAGQEVTPQGTTSGAHLH